MEFQKIISGRNKVQILHQGFRMQRNRGPQGPLKTTYFNCTTKDCRATLSTLGDLDGDLTLNYHRVEKHNHMPDISANIVSSSLHKFRDHVRSNPDCSAKTVFEEITTAALDSVETPNKLDLAKKIPVYRAGKTQTMRFDEIRLLLFGQKVRHFCLFLIM